MKSMLLISLLCISLMYQHNDNNSSESLDSVHINSSVNLSLIHVSSISHSNYDTLVLYDICSYITSELVDSCVAINNNKILLQLCEMLLLDFLQHLFKLPQ